jgi:ubiquinone/menaquinone biosynthesis C-methylase UbiE
MGAGVRRGGKEVTSENWRELLGEAFDRLFQGRPGEQRVRALEIGCGNGRASELLFRHLVRCYGSSAVHLCALDIGMDKVATASRRLKDDSFRGIDVFRGDLYRLPFTAAGFDFLVALNVFFWAEKKRLLEEAARVLKPGGCMLVYDALPRPSGAPRPLITFALSREQILGGHVLKVAAENR